MATISEDDAIAAWGDMRELCYVLDRSLGIRGNVARMEMIVTRLPDERSSWEEDIAAKLSTDDDDGEYPLVSGYEEFVSRYVARAKSHGIAIRVRWLGSNEVSG